LACGFADVRFAPDFDARSLDTRAGFALASADT
jgi:hypothetical protein